MWWLALAFAGEKPPGGWPPPPAEATVVSVYDGDTVTLSTGDKVRVKWVNTPEMRPLEPFAKEGKELTTRLVNGQTVRLITEGEARDSYGRIVAGLMVGDTNLSVELIRAGMGHVFLIPPDTADMRLLLTAQEEAKAAHRGIWTESAFQSDLYFTSFHANAPGDDNRNINGEYLRLCNLSSRPVNLGQYTIENRHGDKYAFPVMLLPPGNTVKVFSGSGTHQMDATKQLELYLGSTSELWDNQMDVATVRDKSGKVITERRHERKSKY